MFQDDIWAESLRQKEFEQKEREIMLARATRNWRNAQTELVRLKALWRARDGQGDVFSSQEDDEALLSSYEAAVARCVASKSALTLARQKYVLARMRTDAMRESLERIAALRMNAENLHGAVPQGAHGGEFRRVA